MIEEYGLSVSRTLLYFTDTMDGVDGTYAPWHRQNMAEQGLVSQSRYEELLKGKHSVLTQTIGHTGLFAQLRSLDVLSSTEEEEIRVGASIY